MRSILPMLGLALALGACQPSAPDPLAKAARACVAEDGAGLIAACTIVIETPGAEDAARAQAHVRRAGALRAAGDVTAALRDYEAALRLDSAYTDALIGRGDILLASGQVDSARVMIDRAAEADQTGRAQTLLARIALLTGDAATALTHANDAIAQDSAFAEAYAVRGQAKKSSGDIVGAREDFSNAIRLDSGLAEARAGRCWISLEADENLEQARDDAEAAVLADPRSVSAQICRGILQLRAREPEAALASFTAALAVEPGNPEALFGHGIARMRTGDSQGSRDMNRARDFSAHVGQRYVELGVPTR
jgi:tetratricopeptide (TPR) repeat protein